MAVTTVITQAVYGCEVCGELRRYPHEANKVAPLCRCADANDPAADPDDDEE